MNRTSVVKLKGSLVLKGTGLAVIPLSLACFFALRLVATQHILEVESAKQFELTRAISNSCNVLTSVSKAQELLEAYDLSPEADNNAQLKSCLEEIVAEGEKLRLQPLDGPEQAKVWAAIRNSNSEAIALVRPHAEGGKSTRVERQATRNSLQIIGADLTREIDALSRTSSGSEQALSAVSLKGNDVDIAALFLSILAAVISIYLFCRDLRRKVGIVAKNASDISRDKPLGPIITGTDELRELDETFRTMSLSIDELRAKERAIVENVTDVICTVDYSGTITKMNHSSFEMLGFQAEELIGTRFLDLILAEDYEDAVKQLRQMRKYKLKTTIENQVRRKNGPPVSVLWSGHWAESERSFYFVAHDITARKKQEKLLKESEAKVRNILESLPLGIIMLNERDEITFVNSFMERMFGFSQSDLLNRKALSLFGKTPDFLAGESFSQLVSRCSGAGNEWQAVRSSSDVFEAELAVQESTTRRESDLVIAIVDVTAEKEIQRMRQDLVGIVSHELRSPLTAIKGFITLLIEGAYGEVSTKVQERGKRAEVNANRLMKLVNELLLIEKLESGVMAIEQTVTDFSTCVNIALESVRELADSKNVGVINETGHCEVFVDPDRLTQVLINLLSNAIKYSESGQTVIIRDESSEEWFEIHIIDEGRGIPAAAQEKIFQRFQQVELGDSKRKGGTGLGLAICKAIIEQHHGLIGVDSELGKGSSFWFRIPSATQMVETKAEIDKVKADA